MPSSASPDVRKSISHTDLVGPTVNNTLLYIYICMYVYIHFFIYFYVHVYLYTLIYVKTIIYIYICITLQSSPTVLNPHSSNWFSHDQVHISQQLHYSCMYDFNKNIDT